MKRVLLAALVLGLLTSCSLSRWFTDVMNPPKGEVKQQQKVKSDSTIMKEKALSYDISMNQEMMQMMAQMINMQEMMMKARKPAEKKRMIKEVAQMKEKMQQMMKGRMDVLGTDPAKLKLNCAETYLKKAADIHELHMKDPKTRTEASQKELMDQIKRADECLTETTAK